MPAPPPTTTEIQIPPPHTPKTAFAPGSRRYTYRVKARNADRPDQETHWSPIRAFYLTAPGDLDRDLDVDINDFLTFSSCYNGPMNPPGSPCPTPFADTDDDGDVDGSDFLTFANCFNGSLNPPSCF